MILTWMYNDLGAAEETFLVRNISNALGFICFEAGAAQVACGPLDMTACYWAWKQPKEPHAIERPPLLDFENGLIKNPEEFAHGVVRYLLVSEHFRKIIKFPSPSGTP